VKWFFPVHVFSGVFLTTCNDCRRFYVVVFIFIFKGRLLVQYATLLFCHYCSLCRCCFASDSWRINDDGGNIEPPRECVYSDSLWQIHKNAFKLLFCTNFHGGDNSLSRAPSCFTSVRLSVCLSVCPSVRPSVRLSVILCCLSLRDTQKVMNGFWWSFFGGGIVQITLV